MPYTRAKAIKVIDKIIDKLIGEFEHFRCQETLRKQMMTSENGMERSFSTASSAENVPKLDHRFVPGWIEIFVQDHRRGPVPACGLFFVDRERINTDGSGELSRATRRTLKQRRRALCAVAAMSQKLLRKIAHERDVRKLLLTFSCIAILELDSSGSEWEKSISDRATWAMSRSLDVIIVITTRCKTRATVFLILEQGAPLSCTQRRFRLEENTCVKIKKKTIRVSNIYFFNV